MAIKKKTITVKPYSYRKNGKKVTVKGHKKTIKQDVTTVTKSQYKKQAEKRSPASLKRDKSRTKRTAITGNKKQLPSNWNTKDYDWIGVDANGYAKIPKQNTKLSGGIKGYNVIKFNVKGKARYYPVFNGNKIGPTRPHTTLASAKKVITIHHGRITGKIKNVRMEDKHAKALNSSYAKNPYRLKDDPDYDDAYDDSDDWYDSSISHSENIKAGKSRYSFREQSIHW